MKRYTTRFSTLGVGACFRWQSNLGGQDLLLKVSATELRNLTTGNRYAPTRDQHYFGPDDYVIQFANPEPNPFEMRP